MGLLKRLEVRPSGAPRAPVPSPPGTEASPTSRLGPVSESRTGTSVVMRQTGPAGRLRRGDAAAHGGRARCKGTRRETCAACCRTRFVAGPGPGPGPSARWLTRAGGEAVDGVRWGGAGGTVCWGRSRPWAGGLVTRARLCLLAHTPGRGVGLPAWSGGRGLRGRVPSHTGSPARVPARTGAETRSQGPVRMLSGGYEGR